MAQDRLEEYRDRRSSTSPEPAGSSGPAGAGHEPVFVVQRHDASSLHFDLRLEIEGVLVSWAVPKGPSVDPSDKRLARRTEDHPLDYAGFEGRIDEGYGAGTVVVWDAGTYENLTERDGEPQEAQDALDAGHLKVRLHGEKLSGAFALTHTRMGGDDAAWMLVKVDDEGADRRRRPTSTQNESVLSGRTNEDLARDPS
ncbi:DNA polymerase ligase N-terminal domain-containing protein [Nocardioides sp. 31GB23]|uniref:DNA polymerase ligase N-terminal domain-containing protein n=1 Tax=Nocardioides sp. 31GB23 TaxID=3156065 RepID=UPI0032AFA78F